MRRGYGHKNELATNPFPPSSSETVGGTKFSKFYLQNPEV